MVSNVDTRARESRMQKLKNYRGRIGADSNDSEQTNGFRTKTALESILGPVSAESVSCF